ncbi:MAG TPA: ABC transporter substrate-binding protein [Actinomycetota bacterium]|nr:ABC transporter substrate-binding protein [Actinomycetota bacterium]
MRSLAHSLAALLMLTSCKIASKPVENSPAIRATHIRVAILDPGKIDPSSASSSSAMLILKQICDTLTIVDPVTGAVKPGIAASWAMAPDAKKVTFKIRPGLRFHNGREVVAADFVTSFSRFASPTSGSSQHFFLEKVVGYQDLRSGRSTNLAGVKAVDATTLEVGLSEPFAEFPTILSHPAAGAPIPAESLADGGAFAALPDCAGPYVLSSPRTTGDIHLVRAPGYEPSQGATHPDALKGIPEEMTFKVVADVQTGYKELIAKKVDVAEVPTTELLSAQRARGRVESGQNGLMTYIGFPVTRAPYDQLEFRRALTLATNQGAIVEELLAGSRVLPRSFLPLSTGPDSRGLSCASLLDRRSDLVEARKSLKDSGVDVASVTPTVHLNSGAGHERWVELLTTRWKEQLGVTTTLKAAEWKTYLDGLVDPGPDGPFRLGWASRFPSPESILDPLFRSGSLDNFTRYSNPAFDQALATARSTIDDIKRKKAYRDAADILCKDLPIIPMWEGRNNIAFGPGIASGTGRRLDFDGDPMLRELGRR